MSNETAKCNDQPASERSCPDPAGYAEYRKWAKCDECGRFIPWRDFENGSAKREFIAPDSHFGPEEYETLCAKHNK